MGNVFQRKPRCWTQKVAKESFNDDIMDNKIRAQSVEKLPEADMISEESKECDFADLIKKSIAHNEEQLLHIDEANDTHNLV